MTSGNYAVITGTVVDFTDAGINVESRRKSNDGLKTFVHIENLESGEFSLLLMLGLWQGKSFRVMQKDELNSMLVSDAWVKADELVE